MSTTEECTKCHDKNLLIQCACGCGAIFFKRHRERGWIRSYLPGHNLIIHHGESHPSWKGGRMFSSHGYVRIWSPENLAADADGYVYEHVLEMQKKLCRSLAKNELVHHKNGIKDMNMLWNLQLMSEADHRALHSRGQTSQRKDLSKRHIAKFIRLWRWIDPHIKTSVLEH